MKKVLIALGLVSVFACAAAAQRVGGYQSVAVTDATVKQAANFAAATEGKRTDRSIKILSINKAEWQLVAGRNYRLCVKVESTGGEDEADAVFYVQTVVYIDLQNHMKLTSWEPTECAEEEDGD